MNCSRVPHKNKSLKKVFSDSSCFFLMLIVSCISAPALASDFPVVWGGMEGMMEEGENERVEKVHQDGWENSVAISQNVIHTNESCWTKLIYSSNYRKHAFGLDEGFEGHHYSDMEYAYYMDNNQLYILESGIEIGDFGVLSEGDELKILKRNSFGSNPEKIEYYLNTIKIHETILGTDQNFYLKVNCYHQGDSFEGFTMSVLGYLNPVWEESSDGLNFNSSGSTIKKTGNHMVYDYAISENFIPAGEDGFFQFQIGFNGYMRVGLTDSDHNLSTYHWKVDYGLWFTGNAVHVRHKSALKEIVNGACKNWRLSIKKEDGMIKFFKGGSQIHSMPVTNPDEDLYLAIQVQTNPVYGTHNALYNMYPSFGLEQPEPANIIDESGQDKTIGDLIFCEEAENPNASYLWRVFSSNQIIYKTSSSNFLELTEEFTVMPEDIVQVQVMTQLANTIGVYGPPSPFLLKPAPIYFYRLAKEVGAEAARIKKTNDLVRLNIIFDERYYPNPLAQEFPLFDLIRPDNTLITVEPTSPNEPLKHGINTYELILEGLVSGELYTFQYTGLKGQIQTLKIHVQ